MREILELTQVLAIFARITEGLWSNYNIWSTHFTLVRLTGIQTELAPYELHQKIRGLVS
jgi:hypothetical protein